MTSSIQQKATPNSISSHLQDLIDTVNNSIQTISEQILEIYETATKEGFTPQEARALIEVKVINVSARHLRRILPIEAKDQSKIRIPPTNDDDDDDDDDNDDEFELEKPSDFAATCPQTSDSEIQA
jgi:uncharacterized protein (UPF0335 family)